MKSGTVTCVSTLMVKQTVIQVAQPITRFYVPDLSAIYEEA